MGYRCDCMNNKYTLKISYKLLVFLAYSYMIIPILIFYIGWLKIALAIPLTIGVLVGFWMLIKYFYSDSESSINIEISWGLILLILAVAGAWVYTSGVGGFWPQREDWHWRNAVLRDLIDYSWPVVYPNGSSLAYYFNFFLLPALVGKWFGWNAANAFLSIYTWVGVCLAILLIYKHLKFKNLKQVLLLLVVFVFWGSHEFFREKYLVIYDVKYGSIYQYTPNINLLQWVTNQTIVPWLAIPLFLDKRKIGTYIFLGMCVMASAPFPFVGMFIIMSVDGIHQFYREYSKNDLMWLKDVFSVPNIVALLFVLPVYICFFLCNTASNGTAGVGGFDFSIPLYEYNLNRIVQMLVFVLFDVGIILIILYKSNKKNLLYWVSAISLLFIPMFRVGTSIDFCMRASIPALYILMIMTIDFLSRRERKRYKDSLRYSLMVAMLLLMIVCAFGDNMYRFDMIWRGAEKDELFLDSIYTFANKVNDGYYCGLRPFNFICENSKDTLFFSKMCKNKGSIETEQDLRILERFMKDNGYVLTSGHYRITPATGVDMYLSNAGRDLVLVNYENDIVISDSIKKGEYEIYLNDDRILDVDEETMDGKTVYSGRKRQFGVSEPPKEEIFEIIPSKTIDGGYMIIWDDTYALTNKDGKIMWDSVDGSTEQTWFLFGD